MIEIKPCPPQLTERIAKLDSRAAALRHQAETANPLVAQAYLRRAAEIDLESWALRVSTCMDVPVAA